ncbi:hypothetical protein GCM10023063_19860 [Arthrobacter methylotrophus]
MAVLIAAAIVAAIMLPAMPTVQHSDGASPSEQPSASASPSTSPPSAAELESVQTALSSGSNDLVAPLIGASPGTALASNFSQQLEDLHIQLDQKSMKAVGGGWDVTAQDKAGKIWHVGLMRNSTGVLVIVYGEAEQ